MQCIAGKACIQDYGDPFVVSQAQPIFPEEMPGDLQQQAAQAFEGGQPGMGGEAPADDEAEGGEPNLLDMMEQGNDGD